MSRIDIGRLLPFRQPVVVVAACLLLWPLPLAAETVCTKLFDRLDEVEAQDNGDDVAAELEDARGLYEQLSCPSYPTEPGCAEIATRINRLQTSGAGRGNLAREKRRLMGALTKAGCFRDRPESGTPGAWDESVEGADNPELFEELYREGGRESDAWDDTPQGQPQTGQPPRAATAPAVAGGRYATLCVRSCDGYYFPISNSAHPSAFAQDEAACKAACPNQSVALYYNRPGAPGDQSLSASGNEPYTALANALNYRTKYDKACQCAAPQFADPQAVDDVQQKLKNTQTQAPKTEAPDKAVPVAPVEEEADTYRSAPVIIDPSVRDLNDETSIQPNGLRGASPAPR